MLFYTVLAPMAAICVALIAGVVYYDRESNEVLAEQFSHNLQKWQSKGQYFMYKNLHKIFYVYEKLDSNPKENIADSTLVLLHGFPTSSYDYSKIWSLFISTSQENKLNPKYTSILTFDYVGFGFSDKPRDYEYAVFDMADMMEMLLLHLNIYKVSIVSHDMGDSVAQEIIRRDNLKNQNHYEIDRVVMLNGGVFIDIYKPLISQHLLRTKNVKNIFAKYFFKYSVFKFSFAKLFGGLNPPSSSEMYDHFLGIKYNYGNEILPLTIEYMGDREQYSEVWRDALNETVRPVMFIYGPADPINPRSAFPKKLRDEVPNVKLSLLNEMVGHYPQIEDPFTVYELIKQHLK